MAFITTTGEWHDARYDARATKVAITGRLFEQALGADRAKWLRADLRAAGITREALFVPANDPVRSPITFHRLRDTCLTWMAVRGDDPLRIQWRAGHTDFGTTQRYIDVARNLGPAFGVPFPALPMCLPQVGS